MYILCCIRGYVCRRVPNYIPHLRNEPHAPEDIIQRARSNNKQLTTRQTQQLNVSSRIQTTIFDDHIIYSWMSPERTRTASFYPPRLLRGSSLRVRKHVLLHTHWKKRQECRRYLERATYREKGTINSLSIFLRSSPVLFFSFTTWVFFVVSVVYQREVYQSSSTKMLRRGHSTVYHIYSR